MLEGGKAVVGVLGCPMLLSDLDGPVTAKSQRGQVSVLPLSISAVNSFLFYGHSYYVLRLLSLAIVSVQSHICTTRAQPHSTALQTLISVCGRSSVHVVSIVAQ
jgi:hypothetical protein